MSVDAQSSHRADQLKRAFVTWITSDLEMLWPLVPFVARIERQGCGGWKVPTVEDVTRAMTALQADPTDADRKATFMTAMQQLGFRSIEMPANRKAAAINDEQTDRVNQFGTAACAFLTANTAAFSVLQEKCETQITWAMGTQYKWLGDFEEDRKQATTTDEARGSALIIR
jgi:hypothetical protein